MHPVSPTLPPELWLLVVASLSLPDLARLSLTSSHLLHIIRPGLYRIVSLKTGVHDINPSHTLALLARNKELAKCVVELRLTRNIPLLANSAPNTRYSLVDQDALVNLRSLKRIVICGRVFRTVFEQNSFGRLLAGIQLEELTYIAHNDAEQWPGDHLEGIRNLKKIVWDTKDGCTSFIALMGHSGTFSSSVCSFRDISFFCCCFRSNPLSKARENNLRLQM